MVLVSHKYRFIYFKTKKTGSTSTEAYFERFCLDHVPNNVKQYRPEHIGPDGIIGCRQGRAARAQATWHAHMSAREVLWYLGPRRWLGYFKFTTIRNPYSKCVSQFLYQHKRDRELLSQPIERRRAAFGDWLRRTGPRSDRSIYSIAGRPVVRDVIRFETLNADVARLAERLHLPATDFELPRFKKIGFMPREHYSAYYAPEARNLVSRAYAPELKRFDYDFEDYKEYSDRPPAA